MISSCIAYTIPTTLWIRPFLHPTKMNESLQAIHTDCLHRHSFLTPVNSALKSFYRSILWYKSRCSVKPQEGSLAMVAPEGLKPQDCEMNSGRSKPPILYIPEKDEIQEAIDSSTNMLKLTLPSKVELCFSVWSKGTPEQFLVHVQQALNANTIRHKGPLVLWEGD